MAALGVTGKSLFGTKEIQPPLRGLPLDKQNLTLHFVNLKDRQRVRAATPRKARANDHYESGSTSRVKSVTLCRVDDGNCTSQTLLNTGLPRQSRRQQASGSSGRQPG